MNQSMVCINFYEFCHIVCGVSCLSVMVHLSALHAMLCIQQFYTYTFRECYLCICKYCVQFSLDHCLKNLKYFADSS